MEESFGQGLKCINQSARTTRTVGVKLQVESFLTLEQATERVRELRTSLSIQPERALNPEDPNADEKGYVWVISVCLHKNAETLYLCTDGGIR
jgi:flagellar basal body rod protein FlgC